MPTFETFKDNAIERNLCSDYIDALRECKSDKLKLFELSLIPQSIPYIATSIYEGWGMDIEYIKNEKNMAQLKTTFAGLTLNNPIIISSSGLTNSLAKIQKLEEAGAGAVRQLALRMRRGEHRQILLRVRREAPRGSYQIQMQ